MLPGIEPVAVDPQLLGDHCRRLAAGQPVVNGFAFERFIEFTAGLDGWLCHGLVGSLFTQSSVRQSEAASYRDLTDEEWSSIRSIAFERHFALNWLCGYAPDNRWDETPTDT